MARVARGTSCPRLYQPRISHTHLTPTVHVDSWQLIRRAGTPCTNSCLIVLCFVFFVPGLKPCCPLLANVVTPISLASRAGSYRLYAPHPCDVLGRSNIRTFCDTFRYFLHLPTRVDMALSLILPLTGLGPLLLHLASEFGVPSDIIIPPCSVLQLHTSGLLGRPLLRPALVIQFQQEVLCFWSQLCYRPPSNTHSDHTAGPG